MLQIKDNKRKETDLHVLMPAFILSPGGANAEAYHG